MAAIHSATRQNVTGILCMADSLNAPLYASVAYQLCLYNFPACSGAIPFAIYHACQ